MASNSLVLCSIMPRYCIILLSVTPEAAPNMSSMADLSQLILLNNDSIPENILDNKSKKGVIKIRIMVQDTPL